MELYHNNISTCAQRVRLVLAEKRLRPVEHHMLLYTGDVHTPDYLAINPKGVVPTLIDGDHVIVESSIICEYLEDAYPTHPLRPASPVQCARMREWTQLPDVVVHSACSGISIGIVWRHRMVANGEAQLRNRPAQIGGTTNAQFRELVDAGLDSPHFTNSLKTFVTVIGKMSRVLEDNRWLAGDDYTLADVAMLPYIYRLEQLALSWLWDNEQSTLGRWLQGAKQRANFSAISEYDDPSYAALAGEKGREALGKLKQILASG